jgi:hypothetical protein
MLQPAMMIKTHSPEMDLYLIKALSDSDMEMANKNFVESGLPYAIIRLGSQTQHFTV